MAIGCVLDRRSLAGLASYVAAHSSASRKRCKLLDKWGVEYSRSERYQKEWETQFEEYNAREKAKQKERQRRFRPILKLLEPRFPRFARFLRRNLEVVESMDAGAPDEEIAAWDSSLKAALPTTYKRFLNCCRSVELGDTLKFGLPHTFIHESPVGSTLPTDGLLCFGDCWLETDGDQVLFGRANADPPVFYYAHEIPELRQVATNFVEWVEGIPKWDSWELYPRQQTWHGRKAARAARATTNAIDITLSLAEENDFLVNYIPFRWWAAAFRRLSSALAPVRNQDRIY